MMPSRVTVGVSLALVAAAVTMTRAADAVDSEEDASSGLCDAIVASTTQPALKSHTATERASATDPDSLDRVDLGGASRRLPRSPFGSADGIGVWTGTEMIVVDPRTRRIAAYDPVARAWTRYPTAPTRLVGASAIWTGEELVVMTRRGMHVVVYALNPVAESWRELPSPPAGIVAVRSAVWTGEAIVVAIGGPQELPSSERAAAAAYYPRAECWVALPDVPGESRLHSLSAAGDHVLAVTGSRSSDPGVAVAVLDLDSETWTLASDPGLADDANAGVWTGSELVILSRERSDANVLNDAAYDPASDSWQPLDPPCAAETSGGAVWTGRLIISGSPWAFDSATKHACPCPPGIANGPTPSGSGRTIGLSSGRGTRATTSPRPTTGSSTKPGDPDRTDMDPAAARQRDIARVRSGAIAEVRNGSSAPASTNLHEITRLQSSARSERVLPGLTEDVPSDRRVADLVHQHCYPVPLEVVEQDRQRRSVGNTQPDPVASNAILADAEPLHRPPNQDADAVSPAGLRPCADDGIPSDGASASDQLKPSDRVATDPRCSPLLASKQGDPVALDRRHRVRYKHRAGNVAGCQERSGGIGDEDVTDDAQALKPRGSA